jgi:hypothetical protein
MIYDQILDIYIEFETPEAKYEIKAAVVPMQSIEDSGQLHREASSDVASAQPQG